MEEDLIYLLIGSNLGHRGKNLKTARREIRTHCGRIVKSSATYMSEAWGNRNQPEFFNQALTIRTSDGPLVLLDKLKEIERSMGRKHSKKWGPRLIDLDILFIGSQKIEIDHLSVPHPAIAHRNFTLVPLMEIAPDFIHPILNVSIKELYFQCTDDLEVLMLED